MEELELDRINANSPYIVELDFSTGLLLKKTNCCKAESHISLR